MQSGPLKSNRFAGKSEMLLLLRAEEGKRRLEQVRNKRD